MKRVKRIEWVSLVVEVTVCSHFAGFIESMLVFFKASSLRSLTRCVPAHDNVVIVGCVNLDQIRREHTHCCQRVLGGGFYIRILKHVLPLPKLQVDDIDMTVVPTDKHIVQVWEN